MKCPKCGLAMPLFPSKVTGKPACYVCFWCTQPPIPATVKPKPEEPPTHSSEENRELKQ